MKVVVLFAVVMLSLSPVAASSTEQAPASGEITLDEKLGAQVPLDLELTDETGKKVPLRQLIDRPTILTLNYFTCGGICTPQLNNLARTLDEVRLEPGKNFKILTVSFDERDRFDVAARKRASYINLMHRSFPAAAWRFLTGKASSTKALADAVGFKFEKHGDTFIHPGALIILSPKGKVTRYLYGIRYLPAELDMVLGEAEKGIVGPTVSRLLRFCFSYDPGSRTYVFNVVRVAGAVVLFLVGLFVLVVLLRNKKQGKPERDSP